MVVTRLRLRDFRSYAAIEAALGPGLTVVHGRNGAGKTNLLEALYFGLTGRSCRTSNEREGGRFGSPAAGGELELEGDHTLAVGFEPGQAKRFTADGAPVERLLDVDARPLVSGFLPDRLELVKGAPALRRAHIDQVVAAAWPARAATRRAYGQALAQRNALIGGVCAGHGPRVAVPARGGLGGVPAPGWVCRGGAAGAPRRGSARRDAGGGPRALGAEPFARLAGE